MPNSLDRLEAFAGRKSREILFVRGDRIARRQHLSNDGWIRSTRLRIRNRDEIGMHAIT